MFPKTNVHLGEVPYHQALLHVSHCRIGIRRGLSTQLRTLANRNRAALKKFFSERDALLRDANDGNSENLPDARRQLVRLLHDILEAAAAYEEAGGKPRFEIDVRDVPHALADGKEPDARLTVTLR